MKPTRRLRIVIPGGTGRLGKLLAHHFCQQGHIVSTISRFPKPRDWEAIHWDAETLGPWAASLDGADAVINLAGRSVYRRYTKSDQHQILQTRLRSVQLVGEAIQQCSQPPQVWLNASSMDVYPESPDRELAEPDSLLTRTSRFQAADSWEQAVLSTTVAATRKVILRTAPVMSPEPGGLFERLLSLVRYGFGGDLGSGDQFVSWMHDIDLLRAIEFLISDTSLEGPVNLSAPHPIPNHQFMCNLRRAWSSSYFGLSLPEWLIHCASFVLRIDSQPILKGVRVVPRRLLDEGFSFHFPEWRGACENLLERCRSDA